MKKVPPVWKNMGVLGWNVCETPVEAAEKSKGEN